MRGAVLDVQGDGLVAQLVHEVGPPVPLVAGRIERVEHALQRRVRQRPDEVERPGRRQPPDRREDLVGLAPAGRCSTRRCRTSSCRAACSGKGGPGGTVRKAKKPLSSSGAWAMKSRYQRSTSAAWSSVPEHRPGVDGADGVQPEQERGDDAEVAAAAAHGPEQIRVLLARWRSRSCRRPAPCPPRAGCRWPGRTRGSGGRGRRPG